METGRGSKSSGLVVEHTLLVAMRRYFKCAAAHLACHFDDYADFGQVTSPFPPVCAKFLALLTNCIRHNPAVFSDLAVNPGTGGDQCKKILCEQLNAFKATRWSPICGRLSHPCWRTAMQMRPCTTNYRCWIVWGSG